MAKRLWNFYGAEIFFLKFFKCKESVILKGGNSFFEKFHCSIMNKIPSSLLEYPQTDSATDFKPTYSMLQDPRNLCVSHNVTFHLPLFHPPSRSNS